MIAIDLGPVPSQESPSVDPVATSLQVGVFIRQLTRLRPLDPNSGARYIARMTPQRQTCMSVALQVEPSSWKGADSALDMAIAAHEIAHWDEAATLELKQAGLSLGSLAYLQPVAKAA